MSEQDLNSIELDDIDQDRAIWRDQETPQETTQVPKLNYTSFTTPKKKRLKPSKKPPNINIKSNKPKLESKQELNLEPSNISHDELEPWNYQIVLFLIRIAEKAGGYRWMHNLQQKKYESRDSYYNWLERLINALITCFTGVSIFLQIFKADNYIVTIVVVGSLEILLVFMMIIIGETHRSREYQEKIYSCIQTARSFSEIEMEIKKQIALKVQYRDNEATFLVRIIDQFSTTLNQSPSLDSSIINKHAKAIITDDFTLPIDLAFFDSTSMKKAKQKHKNYNLNRDPELGLIEEAENMNFFDDSKAYNRQVTRFLAAT